MCPITARSAQSVIQNARECRGEVSRFDDGASGHSGLAVTHFATATAAQPFAASRISAMMPGNLPNVRATLVAPTLRLPNSRMSAPVTSLTMRKLNGIDPITYAVMRRPATSTAPIVSDALEGVLQIGDEVLDVFDADGDAHQPWRDAESLTLLDRDRGVGHCLGMRDQGLYAAERLGERAELHAVQKSCRVFL